MEREMNRKFGITFAAFVLAASTSTIALAQNTGGSAGAPSGEAHGAASPTVTPRQNQGSMTAAPCQTGKLRNVEKGAPSGENNSASKGC